MEKKGSKYAFIFFQNEKKKIVYTKRVANTKNHSVNLFHLHFFLLGKF